MTIFAETNRPTCKGAESEIAIRVEKTTLNCIKMDKFSKMRMQVNSGLATMDEESLILVMGGTSQQLSATGSCGSTGSSSDCDNTAVCNCCRPEPIKKDDTTTVKKDSVDLTQKVYK